MASEQLHEPRETLNENVIDRHRAIVSIMEELEAVDWYDQRAAATTDASLRRVLEHNRDEEKEHAAMTIEWLRRNDAKFDEELRTYLFTDGEITEVEEDATGEGAEAEEAGARAARVSAAADGSLGIGSLKGEKTI